MSAESEHIVRPISALTSKTGQRILEIIALNGPITMYRVSRIDPYPAVSLVHKYVKGDPKEGDPGFEELGLVKVISSGEWRTGLERSEYILAFPGFLHLLEKETERLSRKRDLKAIASNVKKVIIRNRQFFNHPILDNLELLEETLGTEQCYFSLICASRIQALRRLSDFVITIGEQIIDRPNSEDFDQARLRRIRIREEMGKLDFSLSLFTYLNTREHRAKIILDPKYEKAITEPVHKISENEVLHKHAQDIHKFINTLLAKAQRKIDGILSPFEESARNTG